jgi:hypothetical protein
MGDTIKPGGMGDAADAATPAAFAGSMAEAIETALNDLLRVENLPLVPTADNSKQTRDRRRVFVAISRGIVAHLANNAAAIAVSVPDGHGGTVVINPTFSIDWS